MPLGLFVLRVQCQRTFIRNRGLGITLQRAEGFSFTENNFYSAAQAVAGAMFSREGWDHPPGSNCIAWESRTCPAPLVYIQCGDGPATYANPHVRRMLANALDYTSGENT